MITKPIGFLITLLFLTSCSFSRKEADHREMLNDTDFITPDSTSKSQRSDSPPIPKNKRLMTTCIANDIPACKEIASDFEQENRLLEASYYYQIGCNNDDGGSCYKSGYLAGKAEETISAKYFFEKGCLKKSGESCFELGIYFSTEHNIIQANNFFHKACNLNSAPACKKIGDDEVKLNKIRSAINFYEKACRGGVNTACHNLGQIYIDQNALKKALEVFIMACDKNYPLSCYNIACLHSRNGSFERAIEYLEKAVTVGLTDYDLINDDPDIIPIKNDPRVIKLLTTLNPR